MHLAVYPFRISIYDYVFYSLNVKRCKQIQYIRYSFLLLLILNTHTLVFIVTFEIHNVSSHIRWTLYCNMHVAKSFKLNLLLFNWYWRKTKKKKNGWCSCHCSVLFFSLFKNVFRKLIFTWFCWKLCTKKKKKRKKNKKTHLYRWTKHIQIYVYVCIDVNICIYVAV